MNTLNRTLEPDEPVNLRDLIERLWAKRVWIAVSMAVITIAFAAAAFLMTPIYRATTVMVSASIGRNGLGGSLSSALGSLGSVATLAGINASVSDAGTEEALGVLQSRELTEKFIADNNIVPKLEARKRAFGFVWNRANLKFTPAKAFKYFNDIRSIVQDKKTGLITVQVDWSNRTEAADWTNKLIARANEEMRNRAVINANASLGYLEKELGSTQTVETREAISRLIESQIKQRMVANVTKDYAFRVVDPATAPDADDPVRPKKLIMIVLGASLGLFLGIAIVVGHGMLKKPDHR